MNPDLEHLIVLQAQDLDLQLLRGELAEAPRRVKTAEAELASADKLLAGVRAAISQEEKLRRGQESEVVSQRTKVDRLRRSLDSATSAAQVTAFEHEIQFAQTTISRLEDEELASMERTEALEAELKKAEARLVSKTAELDAERARAARTVKDNNESIAGIEHQRKELRAQIDEQRLSLYDRLSKTKGTALAEALGNATQGKCSACQMAVRPQRWQDLTGHDHEDTIFSCDTCGRMLFWDPRRDTPRAWEAGDRLRRAQGAAAAGTQGGGAR